MPLLPNAASVSTHGPHCSSVLVAMLLSLSSGLGVFPGRSQEPAEPEEMLSISSEESEALDQLIDDSSAVSGFGADLRGWQGYEAWLDERFIESRELAESMLADDPRSAVGHGLLGSVLHRGEGNLPLAHFHLEYGRRLLEEQSVDLLDEDAPWMWHFTILSELAFVSGEMGNHQEKLRYLEMKDEFYQPRWPADRGWPLMRLRRYEQARAAIAEALALEDRPLQTAAALTALCAIEAEQQHRRAAYEACLRAAEWDRSSEFSSPSSFTNAAEASLGMLEYDAAESFLLEATEIGDTFSVANPWLDLLRLYVAQNRIGEALAAIDQMIDWRMSQPPFMDEQNRAETEMGAAQFLIAVGYPSEAAEITQRALQHPDRTGFTSSNPNQQMAAAAIADFASHSLIAEREKERASWSSVWPSAHSRLTSQLSRLRAWMSARRTLSLIASKEMLDFTLRPYLAGGIEIPEWMVPELIKITGSGVITSALEGLSSADRDVDVEGYFDVLRAEIDLRAGRYRDSWETATQALGQLPSHERLLSARVAAVGARAAAQAGLRDSAMELFDRALQSDRGVTRRLAIAIPSQFIASSDSRLAQRALTLLRRSPRFEDTGWGARIEVLESNGALEACVAVTEGAVLGCATIATSAPSEDLEWAPRQLTKELHQRVFTSRIDLSRSNLGSLEGSPTAGGGRAHHRIQELITVLGVGDTAASLGEQSNRTFDNIDNR